MNDYLEIEVKLRFQDLQTVAERIERIGGTLVKPRVHERNIRYENAERSLGPSGIVVRLRQDTQSWLTFKSPGTVTSNGVRSRFEAEVEVSDFKTMDMILGQLGYYPHITYEKYRTTYEFENSLGVAEIVLDEMPYGNFVEIEGSPETIEEMISLLGLEDARRYGESYLLLFQFVRSHLNLKFHDLTFENFKNILVPESAFQPPDEAR